MPGPFDWLRTKWGASAPQPVNYFTPYAIAKRTPFYGQPDLEPEPSFEERQAKIRADSEAELADLRALDERLAAGSAALSAPTGVTRPNLWEKVTTPYRWVEPALKAVTDWSRRESDVTSPFARLKYVAGGESYVQTPEEARIADAQVRGLLAGGAEAAIGMTGTPAGTAMIASQAIPGVGAALGAPRSVIQLLRAAGLPIQLGFGAAGVKELGEAIGDTEAPTWQRVARGAGGLGMAAAGLAGGLHAVAPTRPPPPGSPEAIAANMRQRFEVLEPNAIPIRPADWVSRSTGERTARYQGPPLPEPPIEGEIIPQGLLTREVAPLTLPPATFRQPPPARARPPGEPPPQGAEAPRPSASRYGLREAAELTDRELQEGFVEAVLSGNRVEIDRFGAEVSRRGAPAQPAPPITDLGTIAAPPAPEVPPPIFRAVPETVAPGVRQPSLEAILEPSPPPRVPPAGPLPVAPPTPVPAPGRVMPGVGPVREPQAPAGVARPLRALGGTELERILAGEVPTGRAVAPEAPPVTPVERPAVPGAAPLVERPTTPPRGVPRADPTARYVEITDPTVLGVDAKTYQHKRSDIQGVTGALRGVAEWAPDSPPIMVHERADGSLWVVDGHQRYAKYLELRARGKKLPPLVANVKREVEGWTVEKIRRAAALRNIQEPTTDPVDIARVLREGPLQDAERATIARTNLAGTRYAQGEALASLGDEAYAMVVTNELIPPEQGAAIARFLKDPAQQARAVVELQKRAFGTKADAEAFLAELADTPFQQPSVFEGLPGIEQEGILSLVDQKTDLVRQVAGSLRRQRAAFSNLLRNAPRVTEAGNVLVGETNKTILDEARSLIGYFEKYKNTKGTATRRAINDYAERMARGEVEYPDVEAGLFDAIRADIQSGGAPPPGAGPVRPPGARSLGELVGREQPPPARVEPRVEPPRTRDELELDLLAAEAAKRPPLPTTVGTAPRAGEVGPLPEPAVTARDMQMAEQVARQAAKGPPPESVRGLAPTEPPRAEPTPLETLLRPRELDLTAERARVREAVKPAEEQMREVTGRPTRPPPTPEELESIRAARAAYIKKAQDLGMEAELERGIFGMDGAARDAMERGGVEYARGVWEKGLARLAERTKPTAPGQAPWVEHEMGAVVAPPGRDFAAIRLNEGQTHLSKDLAADGWKFRAKWGQWFKNVTEETRAGVLAEAEDILGAAKGVGRGPLPTVEEVPITRAEVPRPPPAAEPRLAEAPAPVVPPTRTWDQLRPNEKAFLTERGGLTREQIDAMTPEAARAHGREVGEAMRAAREAEPPVPAVRRPLPPELEEYLDLVRAKVNSGELPEVPLQAERIVEVNRRWNERRKALIGQAAGTKADDVISLLKRPKEVEFTPQQLDAAIDFYKNVDDFQLKLRRAPQRLTEAEAFPEPEGGIRPRQAEQHRLAQQRAQWLEDGTPDSLQKYATSLKELQDREFAIQVRNHFTEAKAEPPPRTGPGGEFVGGGFGALQQLYESDPTKFWRLMARVGASAGGGFVGGEVSEDNPLGGFIKGALAGWMLTSPKLYRKYTYQQLGKYAKAMLPRGITGQPRETVGGRPALRLMPDAAKDISLFTRFRPATLEHQIPELHRKVWEILDEYAQQAATGALSRQPLEVQRRAHARYYRDAAATAREMQAEYAEAGMPNKAAIARNLADTLAQKPTGMGIRWKAGMKTLGFDVDYNTIERIFGTTVYRVGIGWAADSAAANSTQPILGLRHYGPTDLLHGYRMARTPEGLAASAHLRIKRPVDVDIEGLPAPAAEPTTFWGGVKRIVQDPGRFMGMGDNYNRRVTYLAARRYAARKLKLEGRFADDWAQEVVRTSQADVGPTGFNPTYRGPILGSLRPYQKFPALLAENLFDTLFQANKVTAGTFIATLVGLDFLAKRIVGVDLADMLLMGGRVMGIDPRHPLESIQNFLTLQTTPAGRAIEDVGRHAARTATHPIGLPGEVSSLEDFLDSDLLQLLTGRYPLKVAQTGIRFARYGKGAHLKRGPSGAPDPVTALEDFINLFGFKTTRQTAQTRVLRDITSDVREQQVAERYKRNEINRLYLQALDRGDEEEAGRLLGQLKTVASAIAMVKRGQTDRFQRLLQSASPEVRGALEAAYGARFRQSQVPQER